MPTHPLICCMLAVVCQTLMRCFFIDEDTDTTNIAQMIAHQS